MPIPPAAVAALGAGIIGGTTTAIRSVKTYRAAKRRGLSTRRAIGEAGDVAIRGAAATLAGAAATGLGVKFAGDLLTGAAREVVEGAGRERYQNLRTAEEPPPARYRVSPAQAEVMRLAMGRPEVPRRTVPPRPELLKAARSASRAANFQEAFRGAGAGVPPEIAQKIMSRAGWSPSEANATERRFVQAMEGDELRSEDELFNMLAGAHERKRPALPAEAPALPAGMSLQEVALQGGMPGTVAPGIVVQPRQLADLSRPPQYRAIGHAGTPQVYQPLEEGEITPSPEVAAAIERSRMAREALARGARVGKREKIERARKMGEEIAGGIIEKLKAGPLVERAEAGTSYEKPPPARVRGAAAKSAAGQQLGAVRKGAVRKEAKEMAREIAEKAIREIEKKKEV